MTRGLGFGLLDISMLCVLLLNLGFFIFWLADVLFEGFLLAAVL